MRTYLKAIFIILIIMSFASSGIAANFYVDAVKGSDENTGTSQDSPFLTITHTLVQMLPVSSPMTVHIAPGIYSLSTGETFPLELVGHAEYIGEDKETTIIDATGSGYHVIDIGDAISDILLKDITVTGGESESKWVGSGINCRGNYDAGIKIEDCIITDNTTPYIGGGISCFNSSPEIKDCIISENRAGWGAGINVYANSSPLISGCLIENNTASFNVEYGDGGEGGGIFCERGSPTIIRCTIKGNSSISGAGMHFCSDSKPLIKDCVIRNNTSLPDAGYQGSAGGLFFVLSAGKVINCLIFENSADQGGGIFCYGIEITRIINTNILDNTAPVDSGIACMMDANIALTNCIIRGNKVAPTCNINYTNIDREYNGVGNINEDPQFVSGPYGDYYLGREATGQQEDSPCIDKGSEVPIMGFEPAWLTTRTDGLFDTNRVDMGYHYPPNIEFGLALDPFMRSYDDGDEVTLLFDLKTSPAKIEADLYFVLFDPEGEICSGMSWEKGLKPFAESIAVPENLDIEGAKLLTLTIPSTNPPLDKSGTYTFYLAALKPGTTKFISNLAGIGLTLQ